MNVLSLFSGIGGLDLGLQRAGMSIVGHVESDPWCRRILAKHWPDVPQHDDVVTAKDWWISHDRPPVHVVAGGFPCQPVSNAGFRLAAADPRWLWPEMANVINAIRPWWVIAENVPGLHRRGLAAVLGDFRGMGYRARTGVVSACAMGAPHARERLFILAHADGEGFHEGRIGGRVVDRPEDGTGTRPAAVGSAWWASEPVVGRVAYGVPGRMDRIRGLGNAVVPQVAEVIGRIVLNNG